MSESRAFLLGEVARVQQGGDRGVAPSEEEQAYVAGAPGAETEYADQDEEQEPAGQSVDLPDEWPADFWNALTPEAQREFERGDHDLVAEWQMWSAGQVDTAGQDTEYEVADYEPPMTADEQAEQVRLWTEIAQQGGTPDVSAEAALSYADQWAYSARAAALGEYRAGRRRDLDLHPDDLNAAVQAEMDRRTEEGRRKWGNR